jgi:hypothetical protein
LRARFIVATAVILILQVLGALALMVISVHGPEGAGVAGIVYLIAAMALTSWVAARHRTVPALLAVAVCSALAVPAILVSLGKIESIRYDRRIAATRITNVRDEPIRSARTGKPIGVRVSYDVSVPSRGYFAITPSLYSRDPKTERLSLGAARWTIDGSSDSKPFEPGRIHSMVVELYPPTLFFKRDERCFSPTWITELPENTTAQPLRLVISESMFGATWRGGKEETTTSAYDLAEMFRGVIAEGLAPCTVATTSP